MIAVAAFLAVAILLALTFGIVGMPGDTMRRAGHVAAGEDSLPDEVPRASAEETARQVDERE